MPDVIQRDLVPLHNHLPGMTSLQKIQQAMDLAAQTGETIPSDVLAGLLPEPVIFGGFRIGPVTCAHVLALAKVDNPLAYTLSSRPVGEQTLADRIITDIEAFYLLTMPPHAALETASSARYRDKLEAFLSVLPIGFHKSGFESHVMIAVMASMQAYLPMGAAGTSGAPPKRRTSAIWPFSLIHSCVTGITRLTRRLLHP